VLPTGGKPSRQWFSSIHYTLGYLASYLYQEGVAEWDDEQGYYINSIAKESGVLYVSLTGTLGAPNVGNTPSADVTYTNWRPLLNALGTLYDNTSSGLTATTVQDAIDEMVGQWDDNSLNTIGYQYLPSGLLLQWGITSPLKTGSAESTNFPIAFPNICFRVLLTDLGAPNTVSVVATGTTSFTANTDTTSTTAAFFAIGH
jgi:hypothetical protein